MTGELGADVVSIFSVEKRIERAEALLEQLMKSPVHYLTGSESSNNLYTEGQHVKNLKNAAAAYCRTGFLRPDGERQSTGLDVEKLRDLAEIHNSGMHTIKPKPCADPELRYKAERSAVTYLAELIGDKEGEELLGLWREVYEDPSPEGVVIKALDLLDDYARSLDYRRQGMPVPELFTFTDEQLGHAFFRQITLVLRENQFHLVPSYTQLHALLQCKREGVRHIEVNENLFHKVMGVVERNFNI